jgi:oxepin-CoA hydrolase/3-oxo-5,6-dehydrosuberyl-CoA semialdehyde dehydrogenase
VIIESGLLPEGSLQLACGRPDGLLDVLTGQDLLSVTGSRHTALALRRHPVVAGNAVRFTAEADSLNSSILGPDVDPGSPQFRVFVDAVVTEMTQKTGQKCTAIRRVFVPRSLLGEVESAVVERLSHVVVGDSADEAVRMGPVASAEQRAEVRKAVALLERASRRGFGDPAAEPANFASGSHFDNGAFLSPVLLVADDPSLEELHTIEAFGPVSTLLPYKSLEQALHLVTKGEGSLVASLVTDDVDVARTAVFAMAAWHGRLLVVDSDNTRDSTGHGAAVPHAVHGGPGRAGGGEELAGLRSVHHYLQRTAVQGSPAFLASLGRQ